MLSKTRRITNMVAGATASTLLPDCGSISGSKLLSCSVVILGRKAAQNIDNNIAMYAPVIKQLRRTATGDKFTEWLKDLPVFSDDADRPLAARRAKLMYDPP